MTTSFNPDIHSSSVHLFSFIKSENIYGGVHFCFFKNRLYIISRSIFTTLDIYVLVVFMSTLVVVLQDLKPGNLAVNQDCELKVLKQLCL